MFGLRENTGLVGNQYSTIGAIGYAAQLVAQPFGSWLLVKQPVKTLLPIVVICWGISQCGMAASNNFGSLAATRFLLGWFEAMVLPILSLITATWYRRSEQPMRVAGWFTSNGYATIIGSALTYGVGHIRSSSIHPYQILFLITGLSTILVGISLYWCIDNGPDSAHFLSPDDRLKAVERLRSNQTGVKIEGEYKMSQLKEACFEMKTWLFLIMTLCVAVGCKYGWIPVSSFAKSALPLASVFSVFGPLILQGLAGFSSYQTTLLNLPFGALQVFFIYLASYAAYRFKTKSITFFILMLLPIVGLSLLYALPRTTSNTGALLFGYYCFSAVFGAVPLIVAWIIANTAGRTKKSTLLSAYNGEHHH